VTNASEAPTPFGAGFHPYLTIGTRIDQALLRIPARHRLLADERGLPTGEVASVDGTEFDFRVARPIGETRLDTDYANLERDGDLRWRVALATQDDARGVMVWADEGFPHVMVYTGDTLEPLDRRRQGIAVEPMTCPPNAFRSGHDLIRLEAGASWSGTWGIAPRVDPKILRASEEGHHD
jgi:aldose 1-epimerase